MVKLFIYGKHIFCIFLFLYYVFLNVYRAMHKNMSCSETMYIKNKNSKSFEYMWYLY